MHLTTTKILKTFFLIFLLFAIGCKEKESPFPTIGVGGDFVLPSKSGKFDLAKNRGKSFLLFFGYTQCPDICPMTMAKITGAFKILKEKNIDTNSLPIVLFISVDTARDTIQSTADYISYYDTNAIGLTGTREEIDAVIELYGGSYSIEKTDSKLGYLIDHSTYTYLIDGTGSVRYLFRQADTKESIATVLETFIALSQEKQN